jgi:glucose-1-phosphate thymidylyltransferase
MKGLILAGGKGSRLLPFTLAYSKHLLPIYDKPMFFYPLSTLMLAGIKDIIILSTTRDIDKYKVFFGNGKKLGIKITYCIQSKPNGITGGIISASKYLKNSDFCVILGDNIFYGDGLTEFLQSSVKRVKGEKKSILSTFQVINPQHYGVLERKKNKMLIREKPKKTKSNKAVVGLYFYSSDVLNFINKIKPSKRNELEIVDLNNLLLQKNKVSINHFGRGLMWYDAGTLDDLLEISKFIEIIQKRTNTKIADPIEIAKNFKWIK